MPTASQSCTGCPTAGDHVGVIVIGIVLVGLGVALWGPLGRRVGALGYAVAGFLALCGVGLLVVGV